MPPPSDPHMAKVFIGIPTYNRPDFVQDAILSVRAQTFGDYHVIVSDNRSDGDTSERVKRFVEQLGDERFTFYRQPENGGEYGQGWFFFEQSRGVELFMILHDDDVLLPGFLEAGITRLQSEPDAAFFVSNAYGMDQGGQRTEDLTRQHRREQGRIGARGGMFDVLVRHVECGFAMISGTLFRREALERSGFVDPDLRGNFPFEANIFLRLGEAGAQAWFSEDELMGVRYHAGALRYQRLLRDPSVIGSCVELWARRRFTGRMEHRRRVLLSRYRRAEAMIRLEAGDFKAARRILVRALRDNPASVKAWALAPVLLAVPGALRAAMRLAHTR